MDALLGFAGKVFTQKRSRDALSSFTLSLETEQQKKSEK